MKINSSEMFSKYQIFVKQSLKNIEEEKKTLLKSKEYIISNLENYKDFINNYTNLDFNLLEELNSVYINRSLISSKFKHLNLEEVENKVKRLIGILVNIKKDIVKLEEKEIIYKSYLVKKQDFNKVIFSFNLKVLDEILKGYVFNLGYSLSTIRIKKLDVSLRKKKKINWGESNKKKQELLNEGKIPYEVLERDEQGKIIKDNGGEYWHIHHNKQFEFLFFWSSRLPYFTNKHLYKFKPTYCGSDDKNGAVQKLRKLEKESEENTKYFY